MDVAVAAPGEEVEAEEVVVVEEQEEDHSEAEVAVQDAMVTLVATQMANGIMTCTLVVVEEVVA